MVSGNEFIVLDLFWDSDRNGGTIRSVDPKFDDTVLYWWKCYGCGKSYQESVRRVLLDFKKTKSPQMNNYCVECRMFGVPNKYGLHDIFQYIPETYKGIYENLLEEFLEKSSSANTFYTFCPDCGKLHCAIESTFTRRGSFCCKECASVRKAVLTHGSVADRMPNILPYYSKNNKFPAHKVPVWNITDVNNKLYLICPDCMVEHTKRMDAIINNGAYCGPCAKHKNSYLNGNSLYELYPEVAKMFDGGENKISSKEISPGTHRKYRFKCSRGGRPHIFEKDLSAMVAAHKKGNLGCPVCQGLEIRVGVNDLKSRNPKIAELWDYEKNDCSPEEVGYKSHEKYYFKCKKGHSFIKTPNHALRDVNYSSLGCPVCSGRVVLKGYNDLASQRPDLLQYWDYSVNTINPDEVTLGSNKEAWFHCNNPNCTNMFITTIDNWVNGRVMYCEECRNKTWSGSEKEIVDMLYSWGFEVKEEVRLFGDGQSYDIYLPSEKVAIEYNGLYWHSDKVRADKNYHYNKYLKCLKSGIRLYYIWEDDFLLKKELILKILKNKLGVGNEIKVDARNCNIHEEGYSSVKSFLDDNHIQGSVSGSLYLSLRDKVDNIVAVAVFLDNGDGSVLLKRYCTSCNVRGGFTKIISCLNKAYGYEGVYTFSDNGISDGGLYRNSGFMEVGSVLPDYSYLVNNKRVHKFNYRIDRFKKDPNLLYEEGLTERELAVLNKIPRVWDAGKVKWYKNLL